MKKILILLLIFSMLIIVGCGSHEIITVDRFNELMKAEGLTIVDATDQFEEGTVVSVSIAMTDDYQIELYIVPSENQAKGAFEENKVYFKSIESTLSNESEVSSDDYGKYSRNTDEFYFSVIRVKNTFLYIDVPKDSKDKVLELIEIIGY
jgi:hypothetical protein